MSDVSPVLVEHHPVGDQDGRVTILRLNRPETLNAIDTTMLDALGGALDGVAADPSTRCVLVTGAGRAFSAGGDLTSYLTLQRDAVAFPRFVTHLHDTFGRLRTIPVPVIGLVNGVTAAGGLELLLRCDFGVAARSARIGDGHLNFGQMGGGGVLTLLPRAIGRERAAELLYTGRFLTADESEAWGLVNRVVPAAQVIAVDDGSDDGSYAAMEAVQREWGERLLLLRAGERDPWTPGGRTALLEAQQAADDRRRAGHGLRVDRKRHFVAADARIIDRASGKTDLDLGQIVEAGGCDRVIDSRSDVGFAGATGGIENLVDNNL